jgi:hypothetical protein
LQLIRQLFTVSVCTIAADQTVMYSVSLYGYLEEEHKVKLNTSWISTQKQSQNFASERVIEMSHL